MVEPVEDEDVDEFVELVRTVGANDLVAAMERVIEIEEQFDDFDDVEEEVEFPFYEEDRETAFLVGLTFGAMMENRAIARDEDASLA
jgi:hypothetical protein